MCLYTDLSTIQAHKKVRARREKEREKPHLARLKMLLEHCQ